jgi:hypothetical protein
MMTTVRTMMMTMRKMMTTMTAMANLARTRVALARADEDDAKVMVPCLARVMTDDKDKGGSGKGNNDDGKGAREVILVSVEIM